MSGPSATRVALALALIVAACDTARLDRWHEEQGYRWRALTVRGADPGFTTMGNRTGIRFQNDVSDSVLLGNRILAQGAGVALGDVDGDGLPDVFLARTQGCNALYRNRGGWRFEDVTARANVGACDRYSTGATFADIDGDGDLDLLLLATRGPNAVFVNDGTGVFTERRDLGIDTTGRGGVGIALADVDGDGDLDAYAANYNPYNVDDSLPPQQRAFNEMVRQVGPNRYEVVPEHRQNYKLVLRPDMGGLRLTARGAPDDFYVNDGGRFTRVPLTAGRFRDTTGRPLAEEPESFTLDARFADFTGDGAPDLYVANDFEDTDELWINDGRGGFRRAGWTAQRQLSNAAMGVDVGDVNNDGRLDLFEVDMLAQDPRRLKTQIPTHTALPKRPGDIETQLQQQRNALFVNRGDGTFAEVGMSAGVAASGWSWATMILDVDLDGWQDILVANGHLWDIMDADTHERLANRTASIPWQRLRWEFPRLPQRNVAFRNRGDLTFEDASAQWRFGREEDIAHTLAAADLDGDGDMDVVVNRLGAPALLLRNDATAPRVAVRLVGDAPNTRAVGARIRLMNGATPLQEREIAAGGQYMSHSDYLATFAMGTSSSATLIVDWRDGRRTVIADVRPNRLYEITTATAVARTDSAPPPRPPLFEDASHLLGGHAHEDPAFDDWERQYLLPQSLAHLGPGITWYDYDRDGDEDLFIGAGSGSRLGVFRNDGGRLTRQSAGPRAPADFTTILGLTEGSATRLLIGVASWEQGAGDRPVPSALVVPAGRGGVTMATASLPPLPSSTGPLALGDYDGDGDLDLFIGGRAERGAYPRPTASHLLRNVGGGRFEVDSSHAAVFDGVGLVSSALFADVDGDGDADLLLARDWDSVLLLLNDGGTLRPAPASWGLQAWTGRWNGIAAGDLNGDGRLDLIATSWGRNTMTPTDSANPLVLVRGAFGSGGEEEMLLARRDQRSGELAPLNGFGRVRVAIRDLGPRLGTFARYADASVSTILGPWAERVARKPVVTLDHMAFINRGDRFDAVPLPSEAQQAPASYVGIADFDGDGVEDVFLSQNFFPTAVGLPRYDSGRGLLLLGDGTGGLRPVAGQESGILVYGDQRGAAYADFDRDGRLDLAVSQNAAATKLLRNRGARPGIRVRVQGPATNPDAVGAQLRLVFGDTAGPVREIHAGSGYWSQNGAVQVFGAPTAPSAVWVRWPRGATQQVSVPPGAREVTVRFPTP